MQELHEAELAASVAQDQLAHEQQRTGRLKHAIKSAFEEARTGQLQASQVRQKESAFCSMKIWLALKIPELKLWH